MNKIKKKNIHKSVSYAKWGYIFVTPFFVVYIIFTLYPQIFTLYNSFFENYREGLTQIGPNYVGLRNYIELFSENNAGYIPVFRYLGNTLWLWILGAVPQFLVALMLAVFFTSTRLNIQGKQIFKTVIYMPNLIMASAFSMLIFALFSQVGPINQLLISSGAINRPINFMGMKFTVQSLIVMMNFLMWFGNTTLLLMAGIQGIDECLFESARLDGSNSFQVLGHITLPLLKPILTYTVIISLIGGIQMFDVPQVLTNGSGNPDNTSTTLIMYLNSFMGTSKNFGMAGALSVILFIVTGILSFVVFRTLDRSED
jgi:cellobiose transport system permease protein